MLNGEACLPHTAEVTLRLTTPSATTYFEQYQRTGTGEKITSP